MQSTGSQQPQMLQVALNPAPVSLGEIENIAGYFFVALFESDIEMHFPASAPQQRRLDEIVAEDFSSQRGPAGEGRQATASHEGLRADNGVVAPEVYRVALPEGLPRCQEGAVQGGSELDKASEHALRANRDRHSLDQSHSWVGLH